MDYTKYKIQNTKYKAFTLIEMLIVVTIIAVLASMILVGMGGARAKSRDARRIGDLHNVQNALELYYANNGTYPTGTYNSASEWDSFASTLVGADIGVHRIPKDPLDNDTYYYRYEANDDGTNYVLGAQLETQDSSLDEDIDGTPISGIDCGNGDHTSDSIYCIEP